MKIEIEPDNKTMVTASSFYSSANLLNLYIRVHNQANLQQCKFIKREKFCLQYAFALKKSFYANVYFIPETRQEAFDLRGLEFRRSSSGIFEIVFLKKQHVL